jgi:ELWxxDGT repeat protein
MAGAGGRLAVAAWDFHHGTEIWGTDGSLSGTQLLRDIVAGGGSSSPRLLTSSGSLAFFVANDEEHHRELWKTDGTPQGTVLVKDINPGPLTSEPQSLVALNGRLYFSASDGEAGHELWTSDGTEGGTRMVADLCPGPCASSPTDLTAVGSTIYFAADDGATGRELWALRFDLAEAAALDETAPAPRVGSAVVPVTITLSHTPRADVTVYFTTEDGTAIAGRDYQAQSGVVTFRAGSPPAASASVLVLGSNQRNGGEYFFLRLTGADGAAVRRAYGKVTLSDAPRRVRRRLLAED